MLMVSNNMGFNAALSAFPITRDALAKPWEPTSSPFPLSSSRLSIRLSIRLTAFAIMPFHSASHQATMPGICSNNTWIPSRVHYRHLPSCSPGSRAEIGLSLDPLVTWSLIRQLTLHHGSNSGYSDQYDT